MKLIHRLSIMLLPSLGKLGLLWIWLKLSIKKFCSACSMFKRLIMGKFAKTKLLRIFTLKMQICGFSLKFPQLQPADLKLGSLKSKLKTCYILQLFNSLSYKNALYFIWKSSSRSICCLLSAKKHTRNFKVFFGLYPHFHSTTLIIVYTFFVDSSVKRVISSHLQNTWMELKSVVQKF